MIVLSRRSLTASALVRLVCLTLLLFVFTPFLQADSLVRPYYIEAVSRDSSYEFQFLSSGRGVMVSVAQNGTKTQLWTIQAKWTPEVRVSDGGWVCLLYEPTRISRYRGTPGDESAITVYKNGILRERVTGKDIVSAWDSVDASLGYYQIIDSYPLPYFMPCQTHQEEVVLVFRSGDQQNLLLHLSTGRIASRKPIVFYSPDHRWRLQSDRSGSVLQHMGGASRWITAWRKSVFCRRCLISNAGSVVRIGRWPLHEFISHQQTVVTFFNSSGTPLLSYQQKDFRSTLLSTTEHGSFGLRKEGPEEFITLQADNTPEQVFSWRGERISRRSEK